MNLRQVNENVLVGLDNRSGTASSALGINKLYCIDHFATAIALVTLSVWETTAFVMAATSYHAVGKRSIAGLTELLTNNIFVCVTSIFQVIENVVGDFSLLRGSCAAKLVKITVEPLVNLGVEGVVVFTDLLGSLACFASFGLCCSTVLIRSTDVNSIVTSKADKACVDICRQDTANDVT